MRRFWLLFAQTVTVGLAIWFIVISLKPDWAAGALGGMRGTRVISSTVPLLESPRNASATQGSYRDAAQRAMPSVVNIFTSKQMV